MPPKPLVDLTNRKTDRERKDRKRKATTEYQERRKRSKHSNIQGPSADYGPNAMQPDISREELNRLCSEYKRGLNVTDKERNRIEQASVDQSSDWMWHQQWKSRLTSSIFGVVAKRRPKTPTKNLVTTLLYKDKAINSPSLRWGRENEDRARQAYTNKNHHIKISQAGLVIDATQGWLACSPDNFATDELSKTLGLVEYKCPYSARDSTVQDAAMSKDFFANIQNGKVTLKWTHNYYYQIQGQMAICKRKWCDFVIWTPKEMTTERIVFDPIFWQEMLPKLELFYDRAILPELASPQNQPIRELLQDPWFHFSHFIAFLIF